MSGSGSNAKKLIEKYISDRRTGNNSYFPALIVTDNPFDSNALNIAFKEYTKNDIPEFDRFYTSAFSLDISAIRRTQGKKTIDDEVKAEWDSVVREELKTRDIQVIALDGYRFTTTLCEPADEYDPVCLNVHPGALHVLYNGKPIYFGSGWEPSAKAMLNGETTVRTSVHFVTSQLDGGAVAMQSRAVHIPLANSHHWTDRKQLSQGFPLVADIRSYIKAHGEDEAKKQYPILRTAMDLQKALLTDGDHVVFPKTVDAVCRGHLTYDRKTNTAFNDGKPLPKYGIREADA